MFGGQLRAGGAHFGLTQAKACGEYREKAKGPYALGNHISQRDKSQGQKVVGGGGTVGVFDAQKNHQVANPSAHAITDQKASGHCPDQVLDQPVLYPVDHSSAGSQIEQRKNNEWERGAVVEPGLSRQAKTQTVLILRTVDLHHSRQYRVGG